ncbi:hypothetical protein GBAR_LOCUS29738, partial [Geodia barretti]
MFSIPLYELLIYPCLRNRGPSILQSAGIGRWYKGRERDEIADSQLMLVENVYYK